MLPLHSVDRLAALEIIRYTMKRNFTAYVSHRKKRVALAESLKLKASL
jgi:hypothetical protein